MKSKNDDILPVRIAAVGFLCWLPEFLYYACHDTYYNQHVAFVCLGLGTLTSVFYVALCVVSDRTFRWWLMYLCGCKARDEVEEGDDVEMT